MNILTWTILKKTQILNGCETFGFKYIFPIKYKIRILDLMLLPKNSVPFEGLYYSNWGTHPILS